ncbi:MAG: LOG family protein [Planctomycetales bacterium]
MSRKRRKSQPNVSESEVMPTEHAPVLDPEDELIAELKATADKLARDGATRGDLKILSRALRELRYAFKVFTPYRRRRKVTVFGSARTQPEHAAYVQALEFGRRLAEEGWMVLTGAGGGIMEAAHVGAGREMSMGVNIMLPFEQEANYVINRDEKLVHLKYFFTRKLLFVKEVHAIALFPGGFGTQDEGFETLTLVQTGKRDLMPIVCLDEPGGTYWTQWRKFVEDELLAHGLISPEDLSLCKITDDVEEAIDEIIDFYSVYNSMRYVRGRLVLRLHAEPDEAFVERLNDEFGDIVETGKIEKAGPHPHEADDAHLAHLHRLALYFDRRNIGRLRQMVDLINAELEPEEAETAPSPQADSPGSSPV